MQTFENIVIGFGKGGKTLAKFLSQKNQSVLVIEKSDKMYGGTCINVGCLPSKNLIINGQRNVKFSEAIVKKEELTKKLRNKNYHNVADEKFATVWNGTAKFLSENELEVKMSDGSVNKVSGKRIFINTGATPVIPKIDGLKLSNRVVTSKGAMELKELPKKLAIIGAGYIGLEFAEMFNSYGSSVSIIDPRKEILSHEDDDVSKMIKEDIINSGITLNLGTNVLKVSENNDSVELLIEKENKTTTITADVLLVATGRKPNIDNLNLNIAGVEVENGAIKVDNHLHTTAKNIWALGDVKGGLQFTYISLDDFRIIKDELFGSGFRTTENRGAVPYTAFITPALSGVGKNEKQLENENIKIFKQELKSVPKAHVLGDTRGLFKVIVDSKTDYILGATIYAPESYEVINLVSIAMNNKLKYQVLRDMIYTHPTISETFNTVLK